MKTNRLKRWYFPIHSDSSDVIVLSELHLTKRVKDAQEKLREYKQTCAEMHAVLIISDRFGFPWQNKRSQPGQVQSTHLGSQQDVHPKLKLLQELQASIERVRKCTELFSKRSLLFPPFFIEDTV